MANATVTGSAGAGNSLPTPLQSILQATNVQPGSAASYQLCKQLWLYHPLAGKIVEKPVTLALGKARKISIACAVEDELKEAFEAEFEKLGVISKIRDTMHISRAYGAAAIIYGSPKIPTDVPIDPWALADIDELYFNIFDPLNLAGSIVTNQNPNAPDFQKPWTQITAAGQPYHPSRSRVIFCGTPIYLEFQGSSFSFSGRSLFLRGLFPLKSFIQTMTVNDMVSLKAGLLVAKVKQPGSVVNAIMQFAASAKRALLQEAQTGNVLSIQPDESIESVNMENIDKAMTTARDNIIADIATSTDVPAILLKDEAYAKGLGADGTVDSHSVAQYIETVRNETATLFEFFDAIVQYRAWNKEFHAALLAKYPDIPADYQTFFYQARALFRAEWPKLIEEPKADQDKRESDKIKAITDLVKTLIPILDPENKAIAVGWLSDNLNAMDEFFTSPLNLDLEALAAYEPPPPSAPFGGGGPGGGGGEARADAL